MARFIVSECFSPSLGWMSQVLDSQTGRLIVIAGERHEEKARARAARLEAEADGLLANVRIPPGGGLKLLAAQRAIEADREEEP